MTIQTNIKNILKNIEEVCDKTKSDPASINLVGVTKTIDIERINKSIDYGIKIIGENKVQEILNKYDKVNKDVDIHLIGHLQTNKVKYIVDKVKLIHSVDSIKLAKEINKRSKLNNNKMNVLIQVNVANEESKFGISPKEVDIFIEETSLMENIKVMGLMTIVPYYENPEETRPYFRHMKEIFDRLKNSSYNNVEMKYLSMGMSHDYLVALEEGSNMIRIGTGIFGERNYNN